MEDLVHLISSLFGNTDLDVDSTPRQRVKHALRLSARRRPLTQTQAEFTVTWLNHGLANLAELKLERKEARIRRALAKVAKVSA